MRAFGRYDLRRSQSIRAEMAASLNQSKHKDTPSASNRFKTTHLAQQPLLVIVGTSSHNAPMLTNADYLELADFIGRMIELASPHLIGRSLSAQGFAWA